MRRKTLCIIGCVVLAAVILGVCLLPWPTKIDLHMQGAGYNTDGTRMQEVNFTVTGWKLNYLFFGERLRVDIAFQGDLSSLMYARTYSSGGYPAGDKILSTMSSDRYMTVPFQSFNADENRYDFGYFLLSRDLDYCILNLHDMDPKYLIATADGKGDPDALCKQLLEGEFFPLYIPEN